jgi:hypothetical protein
MEDHCMEFPLGITSSPSRSTPHPVDKQGEKYTNQIDDVVMLVTRIVPVAVFGAGAGSSGSVAGRTSLQAVTTHITSSAAAARSVDEWIMDITPERGEAADTAFVSASCGRGNRAGPASAITLAAGSTGPVAVIPCGASRRNRAVDVQPREACAHAGTRTVGIRSALSVSTDVRSLRRV